jgi:hypothetical protein
MKSERSRAEVRSGEVTSELRLREQDARDCDNVVAISSARARVGRKKKETVQPSHEAGEGAENPRELEVLVDGKRVVVEADRELVLKCGNASITLTRAGKIILRGTHLVSRSSGSNRVQGTQVRIN